MATLYVSWSKDAASLQIGVKVSIEACTEKLQLSKAVRLRRNLGEPHFDPEHAILELSAKEATSQLPGGTYRLAESSSDKAIQELLRQAKRNGEPSA